MEQMMEDLRYIIAYKLERLADLTQISCLPDSTNTCDAAALVADTHWLSALSSRHN